MAEISDQITFVRLCKAMGAGCPDPFEIIIRKEDGERIGRVVALNAAMVCEPGLAERLTRWRDATREFFLTDFQPTTERTRKWLAGSVISATDRILFLMYDQGNRNIGHFGIANICNGSAELDNGILGERGGHPKLFFVTELYLMHLCFRYLRVDRVGVRAFVDNMTARRLHRSVGFSEVSRETLVRREVANCEYEYRPIEDEGITAGEEREQVSLEMGCQTFYGKYSWIKAIELPNK